MFRVDVSENRLVRLTERRFADLNLRERDHLQEWLVRMPDALGEELTIVQKEFDGFADTRDGDGTWTVIGGVQKLRATPSGAH